MGKRKCNTSRDDRTKIPPLLPHPFPSLLPNPPCTLSPAPSSLTNSASRSGTDIKNAASASTSTFVTALTFNAIVFAAELAVFTLIRPYFKAIYEPRTYVPEPEYVQASKPHLTSDFFYSIQEARPTPFPQSLFMAIGCLSCGLSPYHSGERSRCLFLRSLPSRHGCHFCSHLVYFVGHSASRNVCSYLCVRPQWAGQIHLWKCFFRQENKIRSAYYLRLYLYLCVVCILRLGGLTDRSLIQSGYSTTSDAR
jgi:hypothetical protein